MLFNEELKDAKKLEELRFIKHVGAVATTFGWNKSNTINRRSIWHLSCLTICIQNAMIDRILTTITIA
jgi:hypothetical protein